MGSISTHGFFFVKRGCLALIGGRIGTIPGKGDSRMAKSIEEINDKIRQGKAVVLTAEEIIPVVQKEGV